jgi:hypothetical protein
VNADALDDNDTVGTVGVDGSCSRSSHSTTEDTVFNSVVPNKRPRTHDDITSSSMQVSLQPLDDTAKTNAIKSSQNARC